jgi:predicted PurR-regulated permease PerM
VSVSEPESEADREFIARSVRFAIVGGVSTAVLFLLLWLLKSALTPLAAAFGLAYLLDPMIDRFEARNVPRSVAVFGLVGLSVVALLMIALLMLPTLVNEIAGISERMPGYVEGAASALAPLMEKWFGVSLPSSIREGLAGLTGGEFAISIGAVGRVLEGVVNSLTDTLGAVVGLLVVPVIAYYALIEFDRIRLWFLALVPVRYQGAVSVKASAINRLISGFIRGQLIVCTTLGVLYAIGFSLIGIDLAIAIGLLSGVLAIIPYIGSATALACASTMSVLQFGVDEHLALVVGWYVLIQLLEGMVLTPRIVGHSVGLHPVTVIVGLLIGGDLLGFLGLIVAVPITAVAQVFARDLFDAYRESAFYQSVG